MLVLVSAVACIVLLVASYCDIRYRTIPNSLPIVVAGAAAVKWLMIGQLGTVLWAAAIALLVFAVTAVMFTQGWIGGGDVKLAAAVVFLLGAPATPQFILLMALAGGVIAAAMLLGLGRLLPAGPPAEPSARPTVPYGVAIAVAAIVTIALDGRGLWQI